MGGLRESPEPPVFIRLRLILATINLSVHVLLLIVRGEQSAAVTLSLA